MNLLLPSVFNFPCPVFSVTFCLVPNSNLLDTFDDQSYMCGNIGENVLRHTTIGGVSFKNFTSTTSAIGVGSTSIVSQHRRKDDTVLPLSFSGGKGLVFVVTIVCFLQASRFLGALKENGLAAKCATSGRSLRFKQIVRILIQPIAFRTIIGFSLRCTCCDHFRQGLRMFLSNLGCKSLRSSCGG